MPGRELTAGSRSVRGAARVAPPRGAPAWWGAWRPRVVRCARWGARRRKVIRNGLPVGHLLRNGEHRPRSYDRLGYAGGKERAARFGWCKTVRAVIECEESSLGRSDSRVVRTW
jgi:hypothetical protein